MAELIFGALLGAALLLFPANLLNRLTDSRATRIAEIEAGADEAHFEELRELKAYPPPRRPMTVRLLGAALLAISAGAAILNHGS